MSKESSQNSYSIVVVMFVHPDEVSSKLSICFWIYLAICSNVWKANQLFPTIPGSAQQKQQKLSAYFYTETDRDREKQRQTDRETETQRETKRERERRRETETEKQREKENTWRKVEFMADNGSLLSHL